MILYYKNLRVFTVRRAAILTSKVKAVLRFTKIRT